MENTPLTGTTTTTPTNRDGKPTKRYYGPLLAASLALLLGLSFYLLGGHRGGGTNLYREEKETPNGAASSSSSSLSLVGSGTAASDWKTLTIEIDDDATIEGVLSGGPPAAEQRLGGSSAYCKKNTGYNCGAVFPPNGDTCNSKGCCCLGEDGGGMKYNTCDSAKGYAYRGCNSCLGQDACFKTSNIKVGDSSCHGQKSCRLVSDSTIDNDSCHTEYACYGVADSTIGNDSCQGVSACHFVKNSIIGKGSCQGDGACYKGENVKIGNNSCNGGDVCYRCKHNVPDNACNLGITDDMNTTGYCNFCM